ncbi:hypothetical protein [Luteolibacter marinus]|uniref:hypothetical protein n=1 Tax=Luteolibacter marinus TaxID=2776705 RepID=UPI0018690CCD|nr:hypothetical protein [Luteolibacter marinus]
MAGDEDLLTRLAAQAAALDDQAWEALASRGLLRRARKDLAADPGVDVNCSGDRVQVSGGAWQVEFGPAGVAAGTCSCPASGICHHLVAAGLTLAARHGGGTGKEGEANVGSPLPQADEWLEIDGDAIRRWCGAAEFRAAAELARQQLAGVTGPQVRFHTGVECHLPHGADLDGVITSAAPRHARKYKAAAVLAYREAHGVQSTPATADDIAPTTHDISLPVQLVRWLEDAVELGLQHLTAHSSGVARVLAMSCRTGGLHRPALELERVAQGIDWQLARHASADSAVLLESMARLHALASALARPGAHAPADLTGRARSRYAEGTALDLLGVGVYPWQTGSGYRGISVIFHDGSRYLSWSEVRPKDVDEGFQPEHRYKGPGPWAGSGTIQALASSRLTLKQPKVSDEGRLGSGDGTTAVQVRPDLPGDRELPVHRRWPELHEARPATAGLRRSQPLDHLVLIEPAAWGKPEFDQVEQRLRLPITDEDGAVSDVVLPYDKLSAGAVAFLENFDFGAGSYRLLAFVNPRHDAGLMPLTLFGDGRRWDLWFQPPPPANRLRGFGRMLGSRIAAWLGDHDDPAAAPAPPEFVAFLKPMQSELRAKAESGLHLVRDPGRLDRLAADCQRAGLAELGTALMTASSSPGLLRAVYLHHLAIDLAGDR